MKRLSVPEAIILGGTIAAALDILFAISFAGYNGVAPMRLLQSVASGLLGHGAFSGGGGTAALGLALHFALSYLWAALLVLAAQRVPRLIGHPVPAGIAFGVVVFLAMRLVVLPLSAFPSPVTFKPLATILDLLSHMFLFGVPIVAAACLAIDRWPENSRMDSSRG